MTAYNITTFRATPLDCFLFEEPFNAMNFYEFEVFYHTHMVKSAIALIEGFQEPTGEFPANVTERDKPLPKQIALF